LNTSCRFWASHRRVLEKQNNNFDASRLHFEKVLRGLIEFRALAPLAVRNSTVGLETRARPSGDMPPFMAFTGGAATFADGGVFVGTEPLKMAASSVLRAAIFSEIARPRCNCDRVGNVVILDEVAGYGWLAGLRTPLSESRIQPVTFSSH